VVRSPWSMLPWSVCPVVLVSFDSTGEGIPDGLCPLVSFRSLLWNGRAPAGAQGRSHEGLSANRQRLCRRRGAAQAAAATECSLVFLRPAWRCWMAEKNAGVLTVLDQ